MFSISSGQGISKDYLIGTWIPDTYASELTFSKTESSKFNINMVTNDDDRDVIKVLSYTFDKGNFYLKSIFEQNNWTCVGKFTAIDKNTMMVDYASNHSVVVIYKRKITRN